MNRPDRVQVYCVDKAGAGARAAGVVKAHKTFRFSKKGKVTF